MNVIAWLEFELSYFEAAVQFFNYYGMKTPSVCVCVCVCVCVSINRVFQRKYNIFDKFDLNFLNFFVTQQTVVVDSPICKNSFQSNGFWSSKINTWSYHQEIQQLTKMADLSSFKLVHTDFSKIYQSNPIFSNYWDVWMWEMFS